MRMKENFFFPNYSLRLLRKGKKEKDKEWKRSKKKGGNERQKETEKDRQKEKMKERHRKEEKIILKEKNEYTQN